MSPEEHKDWSDLQRRHPGLELVDKGAHIRNLWLRFQAHYHTTEYLVLPAIYRVRDELCASVTFRKIVAFGSTPTEVRRILAKS